jgi:hypothetical protein
MSQTKSKDRNGDLAKVYTNEPKVNAMFELDPLRKPNDIISYLYLDSACGDGHLLIEILRRKLKRINDKYASEPFKEYEFYVACSLTTIYGIDTCQENVNEVKARLLAEVKATFDAHKGSFEYSQGFLSLIDYLLKKNIVVGDAINAPRKINFTQFKTKKRAFIRSEFCFADLIKNNPKSTKVFELKHFLNIGIEHEQLTGMRY